VGDWQIVPTYFFHLHNDIDARDEDGRDLPDLDAARELAREQARFTFAETIRDEGRANLDHRIDIEDEHGRVLETVRFRDVVKIEG
jgi:Domain of unknown function (DUF6894)